MALRQNLRALCGQEAVAAYSQLRLLQSILPTGNKEQAGQQAQARRMTHATAGAGVPSTLAPVPPTPREAPSRIPCLNSINDPDNYGLGISPQGNWEPHYYWLGSSLSNPKDLLAPAPSRTASLTPLPTQGFRSAQPRPTMQQAVFRSSMMDPPLPPVHRGPPAVTTQES